MTPKTKVKFLIDVSVKNHLGVVEFEAKAGEVKELSAASANRWFRRNAAERYIQGAVKEEPESAEELKKTSGRKTKKD